MNLGSLASKAKDLASRHPKQTDQALDKAGAEVNKETGGKYSGQVDSAEQKAEGYLGVQGDQQQK